MNYDILATGSSGNAVVINSEILIDCGVSYKTLEESGYIKALKLVLLTHVHGDHFNPATVGRLHRERPALRWGCCKWMVIPLLDAGVDMRSIDVYKLDCSVYYLGGGFYICAKEIVHDVPNCCYSIVFPGPERIFYATDTSTLDSIEAKDYDLYLMEANHTKSDIEARIAEKQAKGEFSYEVRAARNHLSQEQAEEWLAQNAGPNSRYVFLHQHKEE